MTLTPEQRANAQLDIAIGAASDTMQLKRATALVEQYMKKERRGGGTALEHCAHVAAELARAGLPTFVVIAGLLHDIIEDAGEFVFLHEIKKDFGRDVAYLVDILTKPVTGNRKKSERRHLELLKASTSTALGQYAVMIKLVDNTHNLQGCKHLKRPAEYVKYGARIQAIGAQELGDDNPFVLRHLMVLRSAQAELVNMPA